MGKCGGSYTITSKISGLTDDRGRRLPSNRARCRRYVGARDLNKSVARSGDPFMPSLNAEHGSIKGKTCRLLRCLSEPPTHGFRHDARIPRAAGGSDGTGDVIRKNSRKNDFAPPMPGANRKLEAASLKSLGNALASPITLNRIYHCVPRIIRELSHIFGASSKCTIRKTATGKSRFAGKAARNWAIGWTLSVNSAVTRRRPRSEPDRGGKRDQNSDAQQRQSSITRGDRNVVQRERRPGISPELP